MFIRSLMTAVVLAAVAASGFSQTTPQASPAGPIFHFTLKPGPHPVGLRVVEQYNYARTYEPRIDALGKPASEERARPLQTLVWYPAEQSSPKPMTVGDYGKLLETETSFGKPMLPDHWKDWINGLRPTLTDPLWSVRDAKPDTGKYPLIIYAPSFSNMSWENVDLCEYLASHGYVVVASPDMGARQRGMTSDVEGIEAQAGDISFLIGYAHSLPDVDESEVAVAGFSWGGISNLFAAARDNRITALVALDGSMRYYAGLVKDSGYVHPEEMTIPLLFFRQGGMSLEEEGMYLSGKDSQGPNVLNAWTHGDLITIHDLALTHQEHSSIYQRNEDTWKGYAHDHVADYTRADGTVAYGWIARYTLAFLNAYLKHDAAELAFLKKTPAENGVPPHLMAADFRPAKGRPANLESLRIEAGEKGFDHLGEIYAAMKKDHPDFKLDQGAVAAWAMALAAGNHLPETIGVLKLALVAYPDEPDTYAYLGDIYVKAGKKGQAIESYRKYLEKRPDDSDVKDKLARLEKPAA